MTMWAEGDKAVAKDDYDWPYIVCAPRPSLQKRKIYVVTEVYSEKGSTFLCVGHFCRGCKNRYHWPQEFFEKLTKADTDIFKLADAPVPKDLVLEPA